MSLREQLSEAHLEQLFKVVLSLKTLEECDAFFEDICTLGEVKAMGQRLEVARLLHDGVNYTAIADATGASSTTVSRVNRCLMFGAGGYVRAMKVLDKGVKKK